MTPFNLGTFFGSFWLLIKTNYLLLIFLSCIFLLNSSFIGCMFLRIYPLFFQDCPIWWYRIVHNGFLRSLYFCAPVISFSDINWFFLVFFLVLLSQFCLSFQHTLRFTEFFVVFLGSILSISAVILITSLLPLTSGLGFSLF